jgi:tight adherence protein C
LISTIFILCVAGFFIRRRRKRTRVTTKEILQGDLPELIDQLIVLLRAGYTPVNAFLQLELWLTSPMNGVIAEINALVRRGVRFASAVVELRHHIGPPAYALVDAVIQLDSDGLAATTILDRLSGESHAQRRLRSEAAARELPIRLIFPMVCCVFPSFVMLTVVPMLAGTLVSLRTHLG